MNLVDRIIQRAQRTPYFHLPGYMNVNGKKVPHREYLL